MTVSNAFSRPDQLSAALREKILATAAELGYAGPDPAARTLARGATGTVGILFHGTPRYAFSDEFAARFLAVIAEELGHGGLALTLLPNAGTPEVLPVRDVAMDGAIIYSCSTTESSFGWLRKRRLPLVLVDEPDDGDLGAYSSVNVDDRAGRAPRPPTWSRWDTGGSRSSPWVPRRRHPATGSSRSNGCGAGATCWSPPGSRPSSCTSIGTSRTSGSPPPVSC